MPIADACENAQVEVQPATTGVDSTGSDQLNGSALDAPCPELPDNSERASSESVSSSDTDSKPPKLMTIDGKMSSRMVL
jgi:hypothetical protein